MVGVPTLKVDALRLAKGHPSFSDDISLPGMLHAALLTSPHPHARIRDIDASRARALPGVHAVLTYKDMPRVIFAPGCQSYPNPKPYDQVSLDNKVATSATKWPSWPLKRRNRPPGAGTD